MRFILLTFVLLVITAVVVSAGSTELEARYKRALLGKCIQDKECKPTEYCDHKWPNPVGSCKDGLKNGAKCVLDRHCSSKVCHTFSCAARRPVRNGPCSKNAHTECVPEQYCGDKKKCVDRKCHGFCNHSYQCLSNKCEMLRCKRTPVCPK